MPIALAGTCEPVRSDCPFGPGLCLVHLGHRSAAFLLLRPTLDDPRVHETARELDTETGIGSSVRGVELELGEGEGEPVGADHDARRAGCALWPGVRAWSPLDRWLPACWACWASCHDVVSAWVSTPWRFGGCSLRLWYGRGGVRSGRRARGVHGYPAALTSFVGRDGPVRRRGVAELAPAPRIGAGRRRGGGAGGAGAAGRPAGRGAGAGAAGGSEAVRNGKRPGNRREAITSDPPAPGHLLFRPSMCPCENVRHGRTRVPLRPRRRLCVVLRATPHRRASADR